MVGINAAGGWVLGFMHPAWQLTRGDQIPIALTFDVRSPYQVFGNAFNTNTVIVPMPINSELIKSFRKATDMQANAKGQLFQFRLDGTSQLLPLLAECVKIQLKGVTAEMHLRPPPPAATPVAQKGPSSLAPNAPPPQPSSSELQLEAVQLATNFILKTKLQNPTVLSRAETPAELAAVGAAWKSDEATGFVQIVPPRDGEKGIDVAARVAAGDSRACKGKFASGRVSELVDDEVVYRGFASCEDGSGSRIAQYFIVPRKRGGFVMFSVMANTTLEPSRSVTRDERIADFRRAALTVVGQ